MSFSLGKYAGALVLAMAALSGTAFAQSRVDQLNAAGAVSGTDKFPLCQSCSAITALTAVPVSDLTSFFNANLSLNLARITSGLGTGVATFLGVPSSANLRSALTDETGSGSAVFGTGPTLSSPILTGFTGQLVKTDGSGVVAVAVNGTDYTKITGQTCSGTDKVSAISASGTVTCSADTGGAGGGNVAVTDGTTSMASATTVTFGTGFKVTDLGSGNANVTQRVVPNNQTGASYTIQTTDDNKSVNMTNASATAVTVPAAATAGASFGTVVYCQAGCTLSRSASDLINGATSLTIAALQTVYLSNDGSGSWVAAVLPASDPSNASNLTSGSVPAARGGAGTLTGILKASSGVVSAASAGTDYAAAVPAAIGWVAGVDPNKAVIFTASRAMTVTDIRGTVADAVGSAATLAVYKAPSGTTCSSGTIQHSGTFNANGTAATNQTLTLVGGAGNVLAAGDRLCLSSTGGANWTAGTGNGGITVTLQVQ